MSDKPSDQRHAQREQEKHDGRTRRAELMLTKQAQQKARQDVLEGRQGALDQRLADLERRVAQLEADQAKPNQG